MAGFFVISRYAVGRGPSSTWQQQPTSHLEQVYVTAYVSGRCLRRATSGETLMEVRGGRCHLLHVAAKTSKRIQKSFFCGKKNAHPSYFVFVFVLFVSSCVSLVAVRTKWVMD